MRFLLVFSLFIFSTCCVAQAQMQNEAIDINFAEAKNVNEYAQFHITNEGLLLSDVQQLTQWLAYADFEPMPLHDVLWMRFDIENASTSNRSLVLMAGSVFVDYVDAFLLDSQGRIVQSARLQNAQASGTNISRKGFKMDFVSRAESRYTIYVRIKDDGHAIVPIELWHAEAHSKESGIRLILLGAMSGGLALLATYFLLTYVLRNAAARFWFCVLATASMTTIMSAEGILPSVFLLPSMTAELTSFGLLVSLFASIKITKILLEPMPLLWLRAHYLLLVIPFVSIFILNDFYQLIILLILAVLFFFSNLLASLLYRRSVDLRSVIIYFIGWVSLGIVGLLESLTFANSASHLSYTQPYVYAFTCLGVMLIGVSIISREQSVQAKNSFQQGQQIAQLQQYNDLFQHAAEGLYTALPDGQLIHVNPAICSLFGYPDNDTFLSEKPNLSTFFADPKDVDLLLGELSIQQTVLGKEVKGKRTDGGEFWFSISCQIKRVNEKKLHFGSLFDITERRLHQINLQYLNTHDQLTGLFNRRHFLQIMNERIQSHNIDSEKFALLFLDVDQFKVINDTCGHSAGDIFIKELSHELFDVINETNPFSRLSADQFALLVNYKNSNELRKLASDILTKVRAFQFKWDRHVFTQSMSIGIAPFDQHIPSGEELLSYADTACLIAKEGGRDQIHIYSAEIGMHSSYKRELYWVNEVNNALKDENLALFYQHYRPLNSNDPKEYYEILVRLRTEDNDFVAPEFFMPSAEKAHISHKIDKQVVETYFKWLHTHSEYLQSLGKANINLSGPSLSDDDFKFFLLNAFEKYAIPHEKICFEITETMAIIKMNDAVDFMQEFKKLGCTFALDDFGSGFSSYSYLKNLPVDFVKIDGNFIRDILHDPIDLAMVTSIRDVADAMKIKTVAEFVESPEIMVQIGKLGVDFAQGFCIAKPEPLANYKPFAESQKK